MKLCGRDGWAHPRNHEVLLRHLRSLRFRFSGVGLRARRLHHCEIRFGDSSGTGAAAARRPRQNHFAQRFAAPPQHPTPPHFLPPPPPPHPLPPPPPPTFLPNP